MEQRADWIDRWTNDNDNDDNNNDKNSIGDRDDR